MAGAAAEFRTEVTCERALQRSFSGEAQPLLLPVAGPGSEQSTEAAHLHHTQLDGTDSAWEQQVPWTCTALAKCSSELPGKQLATWSRDTSAWTHSLSLCGTCTPMGHLCSHTQPGASPTGSTVSPSSLEPATGAPGPSTTPAGSKALNVGLNSSVTRSKKHNTPNCCEKLRHCPFLPQCLHQAPSSPGQKVSSSLSLQVASHYSLKVLNPGSFQFVA